MTVDRSFSAESVLSAMQQSLSLMVSRSGQAGPVFSELGLREKIQILSGWVSKWRLRLTGGVVYRLACCLLPQDKLVLYASSHDDCFGNISALAEELKKRGSSFAKLSAGQLAENPVAFFCALARARILVIDAASPAAFVPLHRNTRLIHCWHSGGLYKKMGFHAKRRAENTESEERRLDRIHRGISWFVCSSPLVAETFVDAFHLKPEQMLVFGTPRMDAVLREAHHPVPSVYTVLYAPTYRTEKGNVRRLPSPPDAETLRRGLFETLGEEVRLAFRGHPTSPPPVSLAGWEDWSHLPQQKALGQASVLITDYSSIFFDFLPYGRPVIFYVPDLESYQQRENGLYCSPYDLFPETTCSEESRLLPLLAVCRHRTMEYGAIWQKYMSACDGSSARKLCDFVEKQMRGSRK